MRVNISFLVLIVFTVILNPAWAGPADPVNFNNANLKATVEAELGVTDPNEADGVTIHTGDVWSLTVRPETVLLRILSWNIEFLGARGRTQEQIDAIAQLILTFDAAILALQEITVKSVLEYIQSQLGASWKIYHSGYVENALLYDESKVEMLSVGILNNLGNPPYTVYPGASHRRPVSGVFRPVGMYAEPFRVIGIHCHWDDSSIRREEGQWLWNRIIELLDDPEEPNDIILLGDLNALPSDAPHPQLQLSNILHQLPKENGNGTRYYAPHNSSFEIDYFYVTQAVKDKLPKPYIYVIRWQDYGMSPTQFNRTYSDHYPISIDYKPEPHTDFVDFAEFAAHWLETDCNVQNSGCHRADLNDDGDVNMADLAIFAEQWLHENGLIAHWTLDEAEGSIAHNSIISRNDGTLHGEPLWQPTGGKIDGALEFDGVDDYISTGFILNPADGPFSVFVWIKGGLPGQTIISQEDSMDWLYVNSSEGKLITQLGSGGRFLLESDTVITNDCWHHVGFVWDGSLRHLYVDGTEVARDTTARIALQSASGSLYFGAGDTLEADSFWLGLIDDVRIYNRAISP